MAHLVMWEWLRSLVCRRYFSDLLPRNTHVPVGSALQRPCAHCGKGHTRYLCRGFPDSLLHVQCFAPTHGLPPARIDNGEESETPLSWETHAEDDLVDDCKAGEEDEEGSDSREEEEEEEAEDARSVEEETLENYCFSVQ